MDLELFIDFYMGNSFNFELEQIGYFALISIFNKLVLMGSI